MVTLKAMEIRSPWPVKGWTKCWSQDGGWEGDGQALGHGPGKLLIWILDAGAAFVLMVCKSFEGSASVGLTASRA